MKNIRPEIKFKTSGGLFDAFDNAVKGGLNITDEEYDFICENATDEELDDLLIDQSSTFSEKRSCLKVRNKYLELFAASSIKDRS
jgi:hypothetical protein